MKEQLIIYTHALTTTETRRPALLSMRKIQKEKKTHTLFPVEFQKKYKRTDRFLSGDI